MKQAPLPCPPPARYRRRFFFFFRSSSFHETPKTHSTINKSGEFCRGMLSLCGGCEGPPCLCAQTTSDTVTNRGTNCQPTSKERGHVRVDVPRPGTEREIAQQRGTKPAGKHLARVLVWTTGCQDTELIPKTDKLGQTATKKGGDKVPCNALSLKKTESI